MFTLHLHLLVAVTAMAGPALASAGPGIPEQNQSGKMQL
jgi:hypothetical protein